MSHRICILGAGFAGIAAARYLAPLARRGGDVTVHLLDRHDYTTMVPALPDLAGGRYQACYLASPVEVQVDEAVIFHKAAVTSINLDRREIRAGEEVRKYDTLLLAAGSVTNFHGFDQHLDRIHKLDFLEDGLSIRKEFSRYLQYADTPAVLVAGGGYTGLELACNLKAAGRRAGRDPTVYLVELKDRLLPHMSGSMPDYLRSQVRRQGIESITGASVQRFDGENVELSNGRTFENAFLCWTAGTRSAIDCIDGGCERIGDGRLEVDQYLRLRHYPEVFAAGDAAALRSGGQLLRKAVNFSLGSGRCAGRNMARALQGRRPVPFRPVDLGWIIPLCDTAAGRLLSRYRLYGRLPLALHYAMCGLRNYSIRNRLFFWKRSAGALRRWKAGNPCCSRSQ